MSCGRKIGPYDCCSVVCADCLEAMKALPDGCVDAVITDPQYGIGRANGMGGGGFDSTGQWKRVPRVYEGEWDDQRPSPETLSLVLSLAPIVIIWGGNYFSDLLPRSNKWLIWNKVQNMPSYSDAEMAWTNLPGASTEMYERSMSSFSVREERVHPTQKPVDLMEWCARFANGSILDPFCGSGTTLVAAKKLGRHFLGFEIDPTYAQLSRDRLARIDAQPTLFDKKPEQLELGG